MRWLKSLLGLTKKKQVPAPSMEHTQSYFRNLTIQPEIAAAIRDAERLLGGTALSPMYQAIISKTDWGYGAEGFRPSEIARMLWLLPPEPIDVLTYRSLNPWSAAIGYYDGEAIHINVRKLDGMDHADLVSTLLHERAHAASFGHGSNYKTQHKCLYSVPYYLSENTRKWL